MISQQFAHADVWGYVDSLGIAHFAVEKIDARYELYFRGDSFDSTRDIKTTASPSASGMSSAATAKVLAFFDVSPNYQKVRHHLREAARSQNVEYELLQALIVTESGFNPSAVSPKGAVGLMQLMPATAQRYGVAGDAKTSLDKKLTDPRINIGAGVRYLRSLIDMFPGQLDLALAAYNAGEGAVQRAGNHIPDFKETQNYVKTVMQLYAMLKPPNATGVVRGAGRVHMELGGASGRGAAPTDAPLAPTIAATASDAPLSE